MSQQFQYAIPDYDNSLSHGANIVLAAGSIASRLFPEERMPTAHPDGRHENVSEHSHMLAKVAYVVACDMYPHLDRGKVVLYAVLHDDVEAYVGDTPTDRITPKGRAIKKELETAGIEQLVKEWAHLAPEYAVHVSLYEAQEDAEARFVRVVDKIMTLLIHLPNDGKELQKNWSFERLTWWTIQTANELQAQYPEYEALISVRTELAMYLARKYLSPSANAYGVGPMQG